MRHDAFDSSGVSHAYRYRSFTSFDRPSRGALCLCDTQHSRSTGNDSQLYAYGPERLQQLLFWPSAEDNAPLIAFVHGGGWHRGDMRTGLTSQTVGHWRAQGYAVASINYRLVPEARVEDQAHDVAAAIAFLRAEAAANGMDAERIILAGHSAGAHLAALVGTDPQYLAAHDLSPADLSGVIALDGAGFDIAARFDAGDGRLMSETYTSAFGTEPQRHRALSPIAHAAAPNAPQFLILHVDRRASRGQSIRFGEALSNHGTEAQVARVPGRGMRGHMEINRRLGESEYPATSIVDEWLAEILN